MSTRSPAAAIAWEFRRRYRWGFAAIAVYFVVLAAVKLFVPLGEPATLDAAERLAAMVIVPVCDALSHMHQMGVVHCDVTNRPK